MWNSPAVLLALSLSWMSLFGQDDDKKRNYKKWLNEEVVWIISEEEREDFKKLRRNSEREAFIERFWERRDPSLGTPANECQEEHYRRWVFARENFQEGVPGWKSDRGRIYILHGRPDNQFFYQARNVQGPGREAPTQQKNPDSIVWVYHQNPLAKFYKGELRIVFQPSLGLSQQSFTLSDSRMARERAEELDRHMRSAPEPNSVGDVRYKLVMAGPPSIINAAGTEFVSVGTGALARYVEDLFRSPGDLLEEQRKERGRLEESRKELQENVSANVSFDSIAFEVSTTPFFRKDDDWLVPVEVSISPTGLAAERLDLYVAVLTSEGRIFDEFLDALKMPPHPPEEGIRYSNSFSLPSGDYSIRAILREVKSARSGSRQAQLSLSREAPEQVRFGSILLTDRVQVASADAPAASGAPANSILYEGVRLLPSQRDSYDVGRNLYIYLQFWAPEGNHKLLLSANFILDGQITQRLAPTEYESAPSGGMDYGTVVPLASFQPGEYILQFQVLDLTSRQHDFQRIRLLVAPSEGDG